MRPPRIAILALFLVASLFIVGRAFTSSAASRSAQTYPAAQHRSKKSVWGMMYYNTPFSLFQPNAAISLTDDNSTSFPARPAGFGPKLALKGLSGQLWVGGGFAEDSTDGNGELGCSDAKGWESGIPRGAALGPLKTTSSSRTSMKTTVQKQSGIVDDSGDSESLSKASSKSKTVDDGTDQYIRQSQRSPGGRSDAFPTSTTHADIQSIQEAAEIEGKVVLLMRGGCGFLDKVLWAQRRGAIAVIVGDNQKGGPLIQMFAHGDEVDNVTIPSVFTARTTAQLLSSLTQPGSYIEDTLDDNGNPVLKVQQSSKVFKTKVSKRTDKSLARRDVPSRKGTLAPKVKRSAVVDEGTANAPALKPQGWFTRAFRFRRASDNGDEVSRPPRSGRLDWVIVDDWSDEKDKLIRDGMGKTRASAKDHQVQDDDFVIGVQDWRDPDLVDKSGSRSNRKSNPADGPEGTGKVAADANAPKGGSIMPGSGEYSPRNALLPDGRDTSSKTGSASPLSGSKGHGLIAKLFGDDDDDERATDGILPFDDDDVVDPIPPQEPDGEHHDGLWVTITPTSSASPFFDTLLVLVISPLVTLTVVYALLIIRARVRRRRWRAPKSVVERLPVRTYHTVATSTSASPRLLPSPPHATPTTPLLQHTPTRPRPRSRTTTGVLESESFLTPTSAVPTPRPRSRNGSRPEHEKGSGGFSAEWKKHMGRQVECVVCLEEYVDGVSRVMSLPCGHEFHADCITPWLTTRRRTCPICKGDVVRSLARGSSSTPRYEPYHDDSDDEHDAEGSMSRSADHHHHSDPEQGILSSESRMSRSLSRAEGWLNILSTSFGSRQRSRSQSPEDRDR